MPMVSSEPKHKASDGDQCGDRGPDDNANFTIKARVKCCDIALVDGQSFAFFGFHDRSFRATSRAALSSAIMPPSPSSQIERQ